MHVNFLRQSSHCTKFSFLNIKNVRIHLVLSNILLKNSFEGVQPQNQSRIYNALLVRTIMSWNVRNYLNHPRAHSIAVKKSDNTMKRKETNLYNNVYSNWCIGKLNYIYQNSCHNLTISHRSMTGQMLSLESYNVSLSVLSNYFRSRYMYLWQSNTHYFDNWKLFTP